VLEKIAFISDVIGLSTAMLSPIKFMEFPVRKLGLSRRDFHLYWQRHHSPHVMNVTGFSQYIRKYMSAHVYPQEVTGLPRHYGSAEPFEGASELWLGSPEDIGSWLGSPLYAELIQPDESRFLRQDGSSALILATEETFHAPEADLAESGLTKLFLIVKGEPAKNRDEVHSAISTYAEVIVAQASLRSRLRKVTVSHKIAERPPEGFELADVDAVIEFWFDGPEEPAKFFNDAAYIERVAPVEAMAFDSSGVRALVTRLQVIHDELSFQPTTMQPFGFRWGP
jgi:hypothetical protein